MKSPSSRPSSPLGRRAAHVNLAFCALILAAAVPIREVGPTAVFWAAPAILLAALLIAWAAESAQFFIAQGFALAILAWLQTLPEFAVEAVLAWKRQVPLLMANLTGALRLLIGFGWPMIYATAALAHRMKHHRPLGKIVLSEEHSVEVVGLLAPLPYVAFIWWKGSLTVVDAVVLTAIYAVYLFVLSRMPPEEEGAQDLEAIPRAIVAAPRPIRIAAIAGCFLAGGLIIYLVAEPFLGSLLAISAAFGIPSFIFIQWVAPFVSEFPEMASTFYWARTVHRAPMALMNIVSSNINQWTLLAAMLPVVYSISSGAATAIVFDQQQELEVLMTLGQSLVAMLFLVNMELAWWEALAIAVLFGLQFVLSPVQPGPGFWGYLAGNIHRWITALYYVWFVVGAVSFAFGRRELRAFRCFHQMWRRHVWHAAPPAVK
jgi:cation:H+ antiporter